VISQRLGWILASCALSLLLLAGCVPPPPAKSGSAKSDSAKSGSAKSDSAKSDSAKTAASGEACPHCSAALSAKGLVTCAGCSKKALVCEYCDGVTAATDQTTECPNCGAPPD
jgi:hypothetical protein